MSGSLPARKGEQTARQSVRSSSKSSRPEIWEAGLNRFETREFAGISLKLWLLLGLSIGFLVTIQFLDRWERSRRAQPIRVESEMVTVSPSVPIRAASLYLSWEDIPAAAVYLLHIETIQGDLIVDQLQVDVSAWTPPDDLLPALTPGAYRWFVEAVDEKGRALARSKPARVDLL